MEKSSTTRGHRRSAAEGEKVNNSSLASSLSATIVIPFYKGEEILDRTLASLTLQTYPQDLWNVIIVEEDGTAEVR